MFSTLNLSAEGRKHRCVAFICGFLVQALVIGTAVFLALLFPAELPETIKHYAVVWVPALIPPEKPVVMPPPKVVRLHIPKLETPDALELPPVADLVVPKIRPTISPAPVRVAEAPLPAAPVAQPSPPPKVQIALHTGVFGGAAEPVTTKRPLQEVQTGGFGSPQGLPGQAQGESPGNVAKLGSFGLPVGPGVGNGTGGTHGIQGVVASAGFGSGIAGNGYGHRGGGPEGSVVTMGGFQRAAPEAPPAKKIAQAPPVEFQPIEILSKPSPVYTEEARRLGIQGEVALSVVFLATGAIRVNDVVKSLGHGLDQAAEQAAAQIRFKPAQRDGKPADFPATLRIEFRLADQST
jgi:TonB family protein